MRAEELLVEAIEAAEERCEESIENYL